VREADGQAVLTPVFGVRLLVSGDIAGRRSGTLTITAGEVPFSGLGYFQTRPIVLSFRPRLSCATTQANAPTPAETWSRNTLLAEGEDEAPPTIPTVRGSAGLWAGDPATGASTAVRSVSNLTNHSFGTTRPGRLSV
jgi:hypothetical protein